VAVIALLILAKPFPNLLHKDQAKDSYVEFAKGSVATLQECFDKLGRYGPRALSRGSVQMAPI
jgi:hypothetical protein